MKLLTIIVNYRTADLTVKAVEALLPELEPFAGSQVVIVENDSGDQSIEILNEAIAAHGWSDRVRLMVSPRNGGFGAGVNVGVSYGLALHPAPEYFYLLNPDASPDRGAVGALVEFMDTHPSAGIAGSHLYTPDGRSHCSAFRFPSILGELNSGLRLGVMSRLLQRWVVPLPPSEETFEVDWVAGASFLLRRKVLLDVGLFDEGFFLYFEETDYCLQARRHGWSTWHVGTSRVGHIGGASTGIDYTDGKSESPSRRPLPPYWFASRRRYFEKNHGALYRGTTDAVFLASYALYRLRRRLQRKPDRDPQGFLRDFVRFSVSPPPLDKLFRDGSD